MSKKFLLLSFILLLSSCIETVTVATFGTGYLLSREKTVKETVLDSAILAQVSKTLLSNNRDQKFAEINVSVYGGRVLLVGYSQSRDHVQEAIKLIWKIKNVTEVINEVSLAEIEKGHKRLFDFFLITRIKTKIAFDKDLKAKDINISIYNGNIYILGHAKDDETVQAIAKLSSAIRGVKQVVSHIKS